MYWRWQSLPELADLPAEQRKSLWRRAKRDPFRVTDLGWLIAFLVVTLAFGSWWLWAPAKPIWLGLAVSVIGAVILGYVYESLMILRYRPVLKRLRNGG